MKNAFENSCMKGCLVYVVALVMIGAVGAAGLGSLGAQRSSPGVTIQTTSREQAAVAQQPTATQVTISTSVQVQVGDVQVSVGAEQQPQAAAPTPTLAPAAPVSQEPAAQVPPPVPGDYAPQTKAQGGTITGQASTPFYIVQPGDTLWGIASSYGVPVDTLREVNKLGEEFIKPGQLLYLPPSTQPVTQEPPPSQDPAAPPPATDPGDGGSVPPSMPDTGINADP